MDEVTVRSCTSTTEAPDWIFAVTRGLAEASKLSAKPLKPIPICPPSPVTEAVPPVRVFSD